MIGGILCGLGAAFTQSCSYLFTRHFVQSRGKGASLQLFVLGHLWMGLFGLIGCLLLWPRANGGAILTWPILWPLVAAAVLYLLGQAGLTFALRYSEASRVSPLMGVKVILQALVTAWLGSPTGLVSERAPSVLQWAAVVLCVAGGLSLNYSGGRMKRRAFWAVMLTCLVFSLSDYHIAWLVAGLLHTAQLSPTHAATFGASLQYGVDGLLVIPLLAATPRPTTKAARESLPFAITWFGAMFFLFGAFSLVGVVLGSILQSTRGLMTIVVASVVARRGHEHIEPLHSRGIVLRRVAAGLLMFVAVTLYVIKDPRHIKLTAGEPWELPGGVARRTVVSQKYHLLLTSRFVCEACLTRYFTPHAQCPACLMWERIRPLTESLIDVADNDQELRDMIAQGQQVVPQELTPEEYGDLAAALAALPPETLADLEGVEGLEGGAAPMGVEAADFSEDATTGLTPGEFPGGEADDAAKGS